MITKTEVIDYLQDHEIHENEPVQNCTELIASFVNSKIEALSLSVVVQQRELLQAFKTYLHLRYEPLQFDDYDIECFIEGLQ